LTWWSASAGTPQRRQLLDGLAHTIEVLAAAGCRRLWLNGSFVTAKDEPADFDACWDPEGVDLLLRIGETL